MGVYTDGTWRQIFPFIYFILMFILMGFIDWLYLKIGIDTAVVMKKRRFVMTPERPAFSIWALIFLGIGILTFMNCFNEFSGTFDPVWTPTTFLLMTAWLAVFSLEIYSLSSLILLISVMTSLQIIIDIPKTHEFMHLASGYFVGLLFGWLISATLLNIFIFIQQRFFKGQENIFVNYSFLFLLYFSHILITLLMDVATLEMCWPVSFILLWTVHWVLWKKERIAEREATWIYLTGLFLAFLICFTTILRVGIQFDFVNVDLNIDFDTV